jgi:uncharacterized protein YndB with AHSA1/START domain
VTDTKTLRIERTFQAPAEAVFDAWTSEKVIRRWWQAEHDWETTEAEVDLDYAAAAATPRSSGRTLEAARR